MKAYKQIFKNVSGKIRITKKVNTDRVEPMQLAFLAALHILVRAKNLFQATEKEINDGNTYSSFVLVRAYFETCMALGFLSISVNKKLKAKDLEAIWNIAYRILQGGKHFPDIEKLKEAAAGAFHIYDYFDEVDKDIRKIAKKDKKFAPHREMYDTVLSEFGHPNFLGLVTASYNGVDENGMDYQEVDLDRKGAEDDKAECLNYLQWGTDIFLHYWVNLITPFKEYGLELPELATEGSE